MPLLIADFTTQFSLHFCNASECRCSSSAMPQIRICYASTLPVCHVNASSLFLQCLFMRSVPSRFVSFHLQSSFIQQSFASLGALVLVGAVSFAFITHNDSVSATLSRWNKEPPVPLVIFGMLLFVLLFWRKLMDSYK